MLLVNNVEKTKNIIDITEVKRDTHKLAPAATNITGGKAYVKTPLRYPGGKSRAVDLIASIIPSFNEFREPFIGGGSVFIRMKQLYPEAHYWINDLNDDLYSLWYSAQNDMESLIQDMAKIKDNAHTPLRSAEESKAAGKALFHDYKNQDTSKKQSEKVREQGGGA